MAEGEKFLGYNQIPSIALDDVIVILDKSDTSMSAEGSTVWGTGQQLIDFVNAYANPSIANTYLTITALLADQANQSANNIYYVADASLDPTVTSGEAYYTYTGTTNETLSDYSKLTSEEVTVVEATAAWDEKLVKASTTSYANYDSLGYGLVFLVNDGTNITDIIFDEDYTSALLKAAELLDTVSFYLNIYNKTKKTHVKAVITAMNLVDSSTKMKVTVSGVKHTELSVDDILLMGLPISTKTSTGYEKESVILYSGAITQIQFTAPFPKMVELYEDGQYRIENDFYTYNVATGLVSFVDENGQLLAPEANTQIDITKYY